MKLFYATSGTFTKIKRLRRNTEDAETILWEWLSKNQLSNYPFLRKHPVGSFIARFYCPDARLIVEIDESYYGENDPVDHDMSQKIKISHLGIFKVVQFSDEQIKYHTEKVLEEIRRHILSSTLHQINK